MDQYQVPKPLHRWNQYERKRHHHVTAATVFLAFVSFLQRHSFCFACYKNMQQTVSLY